MEQTAAPFFAVRQLQANGTSSKLSFIAANLALRYSMRAKHWREAREARVAPVS